VDKWENVKRDKVMGEKRGAGQKGGKGREGGLALAMIAQ
jgi:hypothetical protein